jgi:NitT/TauT family transport system substrate-binding protein
MTGGCVKRSQTPKLTRVTIAFQEWVGYGPFYLAQEKGFCGEEGIELVFVDEQLDSARRDAFKQGMLDCEAGTIDLLVSKVAQGTPIVAVMEIDHSFGSDAIVASGNIKTLEDLAGKKVALARDDVGETFISTLFYKKGLSFDGIIVVPQSVEGVAKAFLNGKADACVTWEPQVSEALKKPGAHILTSTREEPGIIIDTLNVRRDLVENRPEVVKKVVRAWFKSLAYYREHPEDASEIISKFYKITPAQYRKQVGGLRWDDYEKQKTRLELQEWLGIFNTVAEVKLTNHRISQKPDALKTINRALLGQLYEDSR